MLHISQTWYAGNIYKWSGILHYTFYTYIHNIIRIKEYQWDLQEGSNTDKTKHIKLWGEKLVEMFPKHLYIYIF